MSVRVGVFVTVGERVIVGDCVAVPVGDSAITGGDATGDGVTDTVMGGSGTRVAGTVAKLAGGAGVSLGARAINSSGVDSAGKVSGLDSRNATSGSQPK